MQRIIAGFGGAHKVIEGGRGDAYTTQLSQIEVAPCSPGFSKYCAWFFSVLLMHLSPTGQTAIIYPVLEIPGPMFTTSIDPAIQSSVAAQLPEVRNGVDQRLLNPSYTPWVNVSQDATVAVTFVSEGAGFRNSLGYYMFSPNSFNGLSKSQVDTNDSGVVSLKELSDVDGISWDWVFPNSSAAGSGGLLQIGDTIAINSGNPVAAGTSIGFFLGQGTWRQGYPIGTGSVEIKDSDGSQGYVFYSHDFLNPEAPGSSTSQSVDDDDNARHVAMMFPDDARSGVILGFEDLLRNSPPIFASDEDFNDTVFFVSSDPFTALQGSNILGTSDVIPDSSPVPAPVTGFLMAGGLGALLLQRRSKSVGRS